MYVDKRYLSHEISEFKFHEIFMKIPVRGDEILKSKYRGIGMKFWCKPNDGHLMPRGTCPRHCHLPTHMILTPTHLLYTGQCHTCGRKEAAG